MDLLKYIFGNNWNILGDTGLASDFNVFIKMLGMFNIACCSIIAILSVIVVVMGLFGASTEGKIQNTFFTLTTPIRIAIGITFVAPVPFLGGLSIGQALFLTLISTSLQFSNAMLNTAINTSFSKFENIKVETPKNMDNHSKKFIKRLFTVTAVQEQVENEWNGNFKKPRVTVKTTTKNNTIKHKLIFNKTTANKIPGKNAGELIISCNAQNYDYCNTKFLAVENAIKKGWNIFDNTFGKHNTTLQQRTKAYISALKAYKSFYTNGGQIQLVLNDAQKQKWQELTNKVKKLGWPFFGTFFYKQVMLQQDTYKQINNLPHFTYSVTNNIGDEAAMYNEYGSNPFFDLVKPIKTVETMHEHAFAEKTNKTNIDELSIQQKLNKLVKNITVKQFFQDLERDNNFFVTLQKYGESFKNAMFNTAIVGAATSFLPINIGIYLLPFFLLFGFLYVTMCYYVPLMPAILWAGIVIVWFKEVVINIISLPIFALNYSNPLGKPIVEQGYKDMLSVLLLPPLSIVSIHGAWLILNTILTKYLPKYSLLVIEEYSETAIQTIVIMFILIILIAYLVTFLMYAIIMLPLKITERRLGSSPNLPEVQNLEHNVRHAATRSTQKAASSSGGSGSSVKSSNNSSNSGELNVQVDIGDHMPGKV